MVAVEIDRGLLPLLDETLGDYDNVTVVSADFMTIDVAEFFREHFSGYDVSVCANLPYYITTPIIMKLFDSFPVSEAMPISSMTFMVQLEVADRICSTESAGDNGSDFRQKRKSFSLWQQGTFIRHRLSNQLL
mgnify:CR=1 FL=1